MAREVRWRALLAVAGIVGMLFLAIAGVIPARGQAGSKEWCAMVNKHCIAPSPGQDILKLCGLGQCRSPCPGERCKQRFDQAQKQHCQNLAVIGSTSAGENGKQAARTADQNLKARWDEYNRAAKCQLGGDIDCFYITLDGLSDVCPAPPPSASPTSSACDRDIQEMHDQHCQNVANWWTKHCKGNKEGAQSTFNEDSKLKHKDYPDLSKDKPECHGVTLPPWDDTCFPPPEVCGAGTSRPSSSGGGGGAPPGGGGGGGGSAGGGGQPPSPPPVPQGPVHGALIFEIIRPWQAGKKPKPLPPGLGYPKGLGTVPIVQFQAWRELAAARDRAQHPLPAPDYVASVPDETPVDLAAMKQLFPPEGADAMSRSGIEAANALWSEVGWLNAFAVHYDRYLGAQAAGDQKAMLPLAEWMATLMDRALAAGKNAAAKQDNFERQVEKKLDEARAGVEAGGGSWPAALKQARDEIKAHGLPAEVRQELTQAGIPDQEIKAFQQRLTAVTPESIEADITALKSPDAAAGPQPLYLADLQAAQKVAYAARDEARAADKAAKEAAAKISPAPAAAVQSQKNNSSRSLILWVAVGLLVVLAILAFVAGIRSSKGLGRQ